MHELSIIQNILDIVQREAFNHGSNKVNEISVEVGTLTGVNIEFLRFSFDTVKKSNLFKDCVLNIESVQGEMKCLNCQNVFLAESFLSLCPKCHKREGVIIKGKEITIKSLLLD